MLLPALKRPCVSISLFYLILWHLPPNEGEDISNIKVALLSCCIREPPHLPAYTPLISDCLQRYRVKDNYLCIKESAAWRLLGSWSFLSSSPPPNHLHLFSFCLLLFFFYFAQAVFHSSLHVDWVIRSDCETSQRRDAWQRQLERTEQRALSTHITANKSFVYKELQ